MPEFEIGPGMLLLVAAMGYLLGSIPFGLVIAKAMGLGDIRTIGSGNIGATNVLRTGSKGAALATLILDGGKGAIAVILARLTVGDGAAQVAGACAFLGHLYPVWLGFKGGKGVATFFGTALALAPLIGVLAGAVWLSTAALSRISSLSALLAALSAPLLAFVSDRSDLVVIFIAMGALIFFKHTANIRRLVSGTEPKIGAKTKDGG